MRVEPEFQIFQCSNPDCRFRFPNNLSIRIPQKCPICGQELSPQGRPFSNCRLSGFQNEASPQYKIEVVLDNLRSTLNVGSIFRTADGAGVSHIYCCGTTPTPDHPKIEKTGLGAEGFLPWTYSKNALDLVSQKRVEGYQIISIEATEHSKSLFAHPVLSPCNPSILIMGNEISGVDPALLELSDQVLHIPMAGKKDSLNVAVAFGIALYQLVHL